MEIKRNRIKSKSKIQGSLLLEALFSILIFAIYLSAMAQGHLAAARSAESSFLQSASHRNARIGLEKIAACPLEQIVVSNWPAETYELQMPLISGTKALFSTNFYLISPAGSDKIVIIQNRFSHEGRAFTNELYFRAIPWD